MHINWFPGHMTKAMRMIAESLKLADMVIYCLDGRAPRASLNPAFEEITERKPCLFVINKCDLSDPVKLKLWEKEFESNNRELRLVSATNRGETLKVIDGINKISSLHKHRLTERGIFRPTRAMVIGVPNCGKSSIINALCGKKSTVTGDRPGVTKGKQWVRLDNGIDLMDTPGTLWGNIEDQTVALHLFFIGSIKDEIVDAEDGALALIDELAALYPKGVSQRYGVDITGDRVALFQDICQMRGFIQKGGEPDYSRGAKALLDDFRKGKLGRITLEIP